MEEYAMTQDEFHSRLYVVSLMATVVAAHANGELVEGIEYFLLRPGTVPEIESGELVDPTWTIARKAMVLVLFGTCGIMGASCLGAITKRFGALSMALTSTARKATTLFLSFALFQNNCSSEHFVGVSLFMSGLMMKTLNKSRGGGSAASTSGSRSQSAGQSAGEQPSESKSRRPGRMDRMKRVVRGALVRYLPFGNRLPTEGHQPTLLRHRSSVDMELGMQTD